MFQQGKDTMTNNQTITYFIVVLVYLISLGFIFNAIGNDIPLEYDSETKSLCQSVSATSLITGTCTDKTFIGNIVTGISNAPIWFNTIFIIIPVVLLVVMGILLILHG